MITIETNSKHSIEKEYISSVIFCEFLHTDFKFKINESVENLKIILPNKATIEVHTQYFDFNEIISLDSLPSSCETLKSNYLKDKTIPIFYGNPTITESDNYATINFDLYGMIFFMLTRWEEFVIESKDQHERFSFKDSFAYKNSFLNRPIVNELVFFLKGIMDSLGHTITEKNDHQIYLTHDIDYIYYPTKLRKFIADIIKHKSLTRFCNRLKYKTSTPFNTFEWLAEQSVENGFISRFYFMSCKPSSIDNDYFLQDKIISRAIKKIKDRKQIIGVHPSYNSLQNEEVLKQEKSNLEKEFNITISEGRQHFLRFKSPHTWIDWEKVGLKIDSSLAYPEISGFRCGTGSEYSVFDFINRKKLNIKERPLIFMDAAAKYYQGLSNKEILNQIKELNSICKRHNTSFTLLFHNTAFDEIEWPGFKKIYPEILYLLR